MERAVVLALWAVRQVGLMRTVIAGHQSWPQATLVGAGAREALPPKMTGNRVVQGYGSVVCATGPVRGQRLYGHRDGLRARPVFPILCYTHEISKFPQLQGAVVRARGGTTGRTDADCDRRAPIVAVIQVCRVRDWASHELATVRTS